jgi:putative flippase GtrA
MHSKLDQLNPKYKFLLAGSLNTLLDFGLLNLLIYVFTIDAGATNQKRLANAVSFMSVSGVSFWLNHSFVFKHQPTNIYDGLEVLETSLDGVMPEKARVTHTPSKHATKLKLVKFLGVCTASLVIFQIIIFGFLTNNTSGVAAVLGDVFYTITTLRLSTDFIQTNLSKVLVTIGSLIFNYIMYKKIFTKNNLKSKA